VECTWSARAALRLKPPNVLWMRRSTVLRLVWMASWWSPLFVVRDPPQARGWVPCCVALPCFHSKHTPSTMHADEALLDVAEGVGVPMVGRLVGRRRTLRYEAGINFELHAEIAAALAHTFLGQIDHAAIVVDLVQSSSGFSLSPKMTAWVAVAWWASCHIRRAA
jgi:hypothetical protein